MSDENKPKGWVDRVLSKVTEEHIQGDELSDAEKVWLSALMERRTAGDSSLDARDLNTVAGLASKLGIKRETA